MKIGVATADITPPVGSELCGYLYRVQPSVGIHDALLARVLCLESGTERLRWIHADVIGFDAEFVSEVKSALAARFGWAPGRVVLSATHTHAGPATDRLTLCGAYDEAYLAGLKDRLVACAGAAMEPPESPPPKSADSVI
jgi:hypothetical protein